MSVLIVDDMSIMRIIIKETLMNYCNVSRKYILEASSAEDAIRKCKNYKPEVVFLDINMPGKDGISAIKEFLQVDPNIHIIMCTSIKDKADVKRCIREGAQDYIIKPPNPDRVIKAVGNLVEHLNDEIEEALESSGS